MKPFDIFELKYTITDLIDAQVELDTLMRFEISNLVMLFFDYHEEFVFTRGDAKFMNLPGTDLGVEAVGEMDPNDQTSVARVRDLLVMLSSHPGVARDFSKHLFTHLAQMRGGVDQDAARRVVAGCQQLKKLLTNIPRMVNF